ncbi:hypothetical protein IQ266_06395 [filamentous cyanobacterium LEGE 11480]|uniref:N-acetyltransferase domain-containing protein n=1 Tax=Romeriopsis navalis LEGE 11480 TaxID=2777977 RepID=A0A928VN05_9CYAN|nr:GNAT family N-acetyltransferase [Romeriopsis navalis]MBE9029392.1 hypothetical protein [Romeriopsis navalis LEGE 11480]
MQVQQYSDISQFLTDTEPFLMQHEATHCLLLGMMARLANQGLSDDAMLIVVKADAVPLLVAVQTAPYNLALSVAADMAAVDYLADRLAAQAIALPGINGGVAETTRFAARWQTLMEQQAKVTMDMKVHELAQVSEIDYPVGQLRRATIADLDLLCEWFRDFYAEAMFRPFTDDMVGVVRQQIQDGILYLWEDGNGVPVTMLGKHPMTSGNARVGPVYTPLAYRCRGYGTASVARVSQQILDAGGTAGFIFTDVTNPTSNSIYHKVGYRVVGDYQMMAFADLAT